MDGSHNDYDGKDLQEVLGYIDITLPALLSVWAILPLLEGYTQHIRKVRDSAMLKPTAQQNSIDVLESLERHISYSVDISAVASELVVEAEMDPVSWTESMRS